MIDAVACRADDPYPIAGWVIIVILGLLCALCLLRARDSKPAANTDIPKDEFRKYVPLRYARECIRLSEQRMAELIAGIQTYEKKALATIAGAVTFIGFMATAKGCGDITGHLAAVCILFSILAAVFSGFIITTTDVGFGGSVPGHTLKYYHRQLSGIKYEDITKSEEKEDVEISFLLLTVLEDYQQAIQTSEKALRGKAKKFAHASDCFLIAAGSALAWLLIKLWFAYL